VNRGVKKRGNKGTSALLEWWDEKRSADDLKPMASKLKARGERNSPVVYPAGEKPFRKTRQGVQLVRGWRQNKRSTWRCRAFQGREKVHTTPGTPSGDFTKKKLPTTPSTRPGRGKRKKKARGSRGGGVWSNQVGGGCGPVASLGKKRS